jgi:hypothetical protein
MPCQNNIKMLSIPNIKFYEGGAELKATFQNHLKCSRVEENPVFEDVAISENEFTFNFQFAIANNVVLKFQLVDINIQVTAITKDWFLKEGETIDLTPINDTIYLLEQTIISIINDFIPPEGLPLDDMLCKALNVTFLGVEQAEINFRNGHLELLLTPVFSNDPTVVSLVRRLAQKRLAPLQKFLKNVLADPQNLDAHTQELDDFAVYMINWLITSPTIHYAVAPFFQHVPRFLALFQAHYGPRADL